MDDADEHMAVVREPWKWRRALIEPKLPASAYRIALALVEVFLNKRTGQLNPSTGRLMKACGLPERTLRHGLRALKESGFVTEREDHFYLSIPGKKLPENQIDQSAKTCPENRQEIAVESGKKLPIEHKKENLGRERIEGGACASVGQQPLTRGPLARPPYGRTCPSHSSEPIDVYFDIEKERRQL